MNKLRRLLPLLLCLPGLSWAAQNTLSFNPPQSDASVMMLGKLFGLVDGVLYGTSSQIVGEMFGVFNSAVLALGGIILMYSLLVSTMNTAHQGEILGQKWSSIWIPMRSAAGVALLLPKASGYCVMQIFVMWVVLQGVGAADKVWNAALDYLSRGGIIVGKAIVNVQQAGGVAGLDDKVYQGGKLLKSLVCMNTLETSLQQIRLKILDNGGNDPGFVPNFATNINFVGDVNVFGIIQKISQQVASGKISAKEASAQLQSVLTGSAISFKLPAEGTTVFDGKVNVAGKCGQVSITPLNISKFLKNLQKGGVSKSLGGVGFKDNSGKQSGDIIEQGVSPIGALLNAAGTGLGAADDLLKGKAGTFTLSGQALQDAMQSRGTAVQQVFLNLNSVARSIVDNNFSPNPQPLGYVQLGKGPSAAQRSKALQALGAVEPDQVAPYEWLGEGGKIPLLSGFELKNAGLAYLAIMRPTLNMMSGAIKGLDFIKQAKELGWIMAGRYFFNLVQVNRNVNKIMFPKNPFTAFSTGSQALDLLKSIPQKGLGVESADIQSILDVAAKTLQIPTNEGYTVGLVDNPTDTSNVAKACYYPLPSKNKGKEFAYDLNCYIVSAFYIPMKGEASLKPPPFEVKLNFAQIPNMKKMKYRGFMGIISGMYNALIVFPVNSLLIPGLNAVLTGIQAALFTPIAQGYQQIFDQIYSMMNSPGNPIIKLADIGDMLLNIVGLVWIAGAAASALAGLIPFVSSATALLLFIMPTLTLIMTAMFVTGSMMAYYIPLVPYILFLFASLAWFIAVIEAMVAAPIVAVGLTHPEGQHEVFGKAAPAVMLLTNVFLRPSMMIIGFVMSMILSYVAVTILNAGFFQASEGMMGNVSGISSLIAPIAVLVIYSLVFMVIVQKSFALIHMLPDKVLRWIEGGASEALGGEIAGGMEREVKGGYDQQMQAGGKAMAGGFEAAKGMKGKSKGVDAQLTKGKSTPPSESGGAQSPGSQDE